MCICCAPYTVLGTVNTLDIPGLTEFRSREGSWEKGDAGGGRGRVGKVFSYNKQTHDTLAAGAELLGGRSSSWISGLADVVIDGAIH